MEGVNQREYQTVMLGAMLHDVGKLLQRGSFGALDTKGKHPQVSANFVSTFKDFFSKFVDFDLLQTLVQKHHEDPRLGKDLICKNAPDKYRALSYLVSRSDNYSSSERGEKAEEYQDFKSVPLVSIFSCIKLDKALPVKLKYYAKPLNPEDAFPKKFDEYKLGELNDHLRGFGEKFNMLVKSTEHINQVDFDTMFANIFAILMQYTWCIPSNTQEEIPDVSLFDHLKTTCAIAACLYQYHSLDFKENKIKNDKIDKFILLVGDLSGIQNYIFNITHIGAGGVSKRLRARSFQINMLSEIVSHKILHAFSLPLANILMASGGKFYILLPNLTDANERIQAIKQDTDSWFYEKFNAEINLNIETIRLSGNDFGNYGESLKKLNQSLQRIKKNPFNEIMIENGLWNEAVATVNIDFGDEEKLCKACNKFPGKIDEDKYICDKCNDDKAIGQKLTDTKYIAFYKDKGGEFNKSYLDYSFDLLKTLRQVKHGAYLILSIDEFETSTEFPVTHRVIANHVSKFITDHDCNDCENIKCSERDSAEKNKPKSFECVVSESKGRQLLGYLKADVDNLGEVFACGLRDNNTVSRVATLSRMLDVFFCGYMQQLIEVSYPEIYTVYSGGDDVLVIGPWDVIINFADELNARFKEFTCNNENITLSAGIAFVKHNYPVFRAVEMADNFLDISKGNKGKDSLTIFAHTVKWSDVSGIIQESEMLEKWLKQKDISMGFARNLLIYSKMSDKFQRTGETRYLKFLPLMAYDVARNLPSLDSNDPKKREIRQWAEDLKDSRGLKLKNLGIIANYALTANRGEKNE
ncbi:MAG: type III-A CRISPR-associated protein Cas10/Csm1 [Candidatus Desantisbacteria bacterium]